MTDNGVYIIAEIGINHNGDLSIAKELIDVADRAGCDAVKFQKREPEICVPDEQKSVMRDTPWGRIPYIEYKHKIEFGMEDYRQIDRYCDTLGIDWSMSVWDEPSLEFSLNFDLPWIKVPSPLLTDRDLVRQTHVEYPQVIMSTGMSTWEQVEWAVYNDNNKLATQWLAQCTSIYPCPPEKLDLNVIDYYRRAYPTCTIGYSGHELGLQTTVAAVAMGAEFVERHITLDRSMWGSDQSASVEPQGLERLVRDIRVVEEAMGHGRKRVHPEEGEKIKSLRRK